MTTVKRVRFVPAGGTVRDSIERPVRWTKILRWHFPGGTAVNVLVLLLVLTGAILAPLPVAVALTLGHLVVNEYLGVRRWTAVLAYPALFAFVPTVLY